MEIQIKEYEDDLLNEGSLREMDQDHLLQLSSQNCQSNQELYYASDPRRIAEEDEDCYSDSCADKVNEDDDEDDLDEHEDGESESVHEYGQMITGPVASSNLVLSSDGFDLNHGTTPAEDNISSYRNGATQLLADDQCDALELGTSEENDPCEG